RRPAQLAQVDRGRREPHRADGGLGPLHAWVSSAQPLAGSVKAPASGSPLPNRSRKRDAGRAVPVSSTGSSEALTQTHATPVPDSRLTTTAPRTFRTCARPRRNG